MPESRAIRTFLDTRRRVAAVAFSCAVIFAGITACGTATSSRPATASSAKPPVSPLAGLTAKQIVSKAIKDLKAVSSVHMTGWAKTSGQIVTVDLTLGSKGCTGTLRLSGTGSLVLVKMGKTVWIKPDQQLWKYWTGTNGAAVVMLLEGKYLRLSAKDSQLNWVGSLCDPRQFASGVSDQTSGWAKGKTATISGQPALQLDGTGDVHTAYVTISVTPEFVRVDGGPSRHLDFTGYNAPMALAAPPADETIDGSQLGF